VIKKTVRGIGRVVKPLVNFPVWMGLSRLRENNQKLGRLAKSVLTPTKVDVHRETFEAAVERLGLDEPMIQARQFYFKRLAIVYLLIAIALLGYAFYLLIIVGALIGFLMVLIAIWIALALAFKQHFWYTQMKARRLGLSFREWLSITLRITKRVGT
jgi:intracellular multiplication protein IcmV